MFKKYRHINHFIKFYIKKNQQTTNKMTFWLHNHENNTITNDVQILHNSIVADEAHVAYKCRVCIHGFGC